MNELQESLLKAMSEVGATVSKPSKSSTPLVINTKLIRLKDKGTQEWSFFYGGSTFSAFNPSGYKLKSNDEVYIMVPEGDFSKKSIILSKVDPSAPTIINQAYRKTLKDASENFFQPILKLESDTFDFAKTQNVNKVGSFKNVSQGAANKRLNRKIEYYLDRGYNIFALSFDVKSYFPINYHNSVRDYGVQLKVPVINIIENEKTDFTINFDCTEMLGDVFDLKDWTPQIKYFTIPNKYSFDISRNIQLRTYFKETPFMLRANTTASIPGITPAKNYIKMTNFSFNFVEPISENYLDGYDVEIGCENGIFYFNNDDKPKILTAKLFLNGERTLYRPGVYDVYWFLEKSDIRENNDLYNEFGGRGWACVNNTYKKTKDIFGNIKHFFVANNNSLIINKEDIIGDNNRYKCVVVINDKPVASSIIEIINLDSEYGGKINIDGGGSVLSARSAGSAVLSYDFKKVPSGNLIYNFYDFNLDTKEIDYDSEISFERLDTNKVQAALSSSKSDCFCCIVKSIRVNSKGNLIVKDISFDIINIPYYPNEFPYTLKISVTRNNFQYDANGKHKFNMTKRLPILVNFTIKGSNGKEFTASQYKNVKYAWIFPETAKNPFDIEDIHIGKDRIPLPPDNTLTGKGNPELTLVLDKKAKKYHSVYNTSPVQLRININDQVTYQDLPITFEKEKIEDYGEGYNAFFYNAGETSEPEVDRLKFLLYLDKSQSYIPPKVPDDQAHAEGEGIKSPRHMLFYPGKDNTYTKLTTTAEEKYVIPNLGIKLYEDSEFIDNTKNDKYTLKFDFLDSTSGGGIYHIEKQYTTVKDSDNQESKVFNGKFNLEMARQKMLEKALSIRKETEGFTYLTCVVRVKITVLDNGDHFYIYLPVDFSIVSLDEFEGYSAKEPSGGGQSPLEKAVVKFLKKNYVDNFISGGYDEVMFAKGKKECFYGEDITFKYDTAFDYFEDIANKQYGFKKPLIKELLKFHWTTNIRSIGESTDLTVDIKPPTSFSYKDKRIDKFVAVRVENYNDVTKKAEANQMITTETAKFSGLKAEVVAYKGEENEDKSKNTGLYQIPILYKPGDTVLDECQYLADFLDEKTAILYTFEELQDEVKEAEEDSEKFSFTDNNLAALQNLKASLIICSEALDSAINSSYLDNLKTIDYDSCSFDVDFDTNKTYQEYLHGEDINFLITMYNKEIDNLKKKDRTLFENALNELTGSKGLKQDIIKIKNILGKNKLSSSFEEVLNYYSNQMDNVSSEKQIIEIFDGVYYNCLKAFYDLNGLNITLLDYFLEKVDEEINYYQRILDQAEDLDKLLKVDFVCPIKPILYTYSLKKQSTNIDFWDGSLIKVDNNVCLFNPTSGYGQFNENGEFSGLLMTQKQTYKNNEPMEDMVRGLFAYKDGEEILSITETGDIFIKGLTDKKEET